MKDWPGDFSLFFFYSRGARARGYVDFTGSFYLYIVALQQNPLLVLGHAVFLFPLPY